MSSPGPNLVSEVEEVAAPFPKVTGGVRYAPTGTTIPTDATSPLDPAFITLGRVSSDGVERTVDRGQVDVYDWGSNLVAVLQDKYGVHLKFKLMQVMNADVQSAAHGTDRVTVTPPTTSIGTTISSAFNPKLLDTGVWVIDAYYMLMSMRFVVPIGRPVNVGPTTWVNKALAMYDITVRAFPDNNNNHAYEYWNDGIVAA